MGDNDQLYDVREAGRIYTCGMSFSKSLRAPLLAAIVAIGASLAFFLLRDTGLQNAAIAITAIIGAVSVWFQMKRSKDMAEGEFILSLNTSFNENPDIRMLYSKLCQGVPLVEDDRVAIVDYLTFFETMLLLLRRNVLDMKLMDDLFRYRFTIAVTNADVQQMELIPDAKYYRNIYTLDYLWDKYRSSKGNVEDSPQSLRIANRDYLSFVDQIGK